MKNLMRSKTLIVILVIVILVIAYFYYEGGSSSAASSLLVSQGTDQSIGTAELNLLNQVQSLKIDPSLFQDPGYKSLEDDSVIIPQDNVGRPNPFEPFPGEAIAPPASDPAGTSPTAP